MELLTRKEVMKLLKISKNTLLRYEKHGILKPIRVSERKVLYDANDIYALLEAKKAKKEG
ncbi:MAG: helix-turn-helix domain-containing protein [Archaeoglobaceae archaeon]